MAHLSERHELAKRRRDELVRDRSVALAIRTGYPEMFHSSTTISRTTRVAVPAVDAPVFDDAFGQTQELKKYSNEDLAAAQERCAERLKSAREKESQARRRQREQDHEQLTRDRPSSSEAAAMAAQRIRDRKSKDRRLEEEEIDLLISQQTSSIKAMNIARMLSPRFEERVEFVAAVTKYSPEDERVVHLLTNQRVGTFYQ